MRANIVIRQTHRWLSILFTLAVVAIFAAMAVTTPPQWLFYTPLPFLFLLIPTGLYLFALPYMARRKG